MIVPKFDKWLVGTKVRTWNATVAEDKLKSSWGMRDSWVKLLFGTLDPYHKRRWRVIDETATFTWRVYAVEAKWTCSF